MKPLPIFKSRIYARNESMLKAFHRKSASMLRNTSTQEDKQRDSDILYVHNCAINTFFVSCFKISIYMACTQYVVFIISVFTLLKKLVKL